MSINSNKLTRTFQHPTLGQLKGLNLESGSVTQFRGIPFASIPGRWKEPILLNRKLADDTFDATRYGPSCPQGPGGQRADLELLGNIPTEEKTFDMSELECLNLVITRPAKLPQDGKVPTLVWVHGGYFSVGSNAWPQYDLSKFVSHSTQRARPIICVSINYRLGMFGFAASGEAGISGNFGLKDQACAFRWIQKNISGFGGDPNLITAIGESAGSICLSTLLATHEPLFSRVILMSGEVSLRRPKSIEWHEAMLRQNLARLNIEYETIGEAVEKLRAMPASVICESLPLIQHWSPLLDSDFLAGLHNDDLEMTNTWCESMLIGSMLHDGTVLRSRYLDKTMARETTMAGLQKFLTRDECLRIQRLYRLDGDEAQQKTGRLELISDLRFYLPVVATSEKLRPIGNLTVRQYHMHQPNPFPGINQGLASHELDVALLFQNFEPWLSDMDVKVGKKMADVLSDFAYHNDRAFDSTKVLVVGPNHELNYFNSEQYDMKFRNGRGSVLREIGLEKCLSLGTWLQGA